jgi:hypothetical protein
MGIVTVQGKKAVIVSRMGNQARVRFLDTREEANVNVTELKPDTTLESLAAVWRSLEPGLTEKKKRRVFAAILKLEHSIAYLPKRLQEELEDMGPQTVSEPPQPQFDKPEDDSPVEDEEGGKRGFSSSKWTMELFSICAAGRTRTKRADDRNPMPEPPQKLSWSRGGTAPD